VTELLQWRWTYLEWATSVGMPVSVDFAGKKASDADRALRFSHPAYTGLDVL